MAAFRRFFDALIAAPIATAVGKVTALIVRKRSQYIAFAVLSLGVAALVVMLDFSNDLAFARFLGPASPSLVFLGVIVLGFVLWSILLDRGWFVIYAKDNASGLRRAAGLATGLAFIMIVLDPMIGLPRDLNIPFPDAVLLYPAMGFLVEIVFHLLPLTLLLIFLTPVRRNIGHGPVVWACIVVVALLEPAYQVAALESAAPYPPWAVWYVGLHVFLINLLQLHFFKRYDFVTMYAFRLAYYLLWHLVWGYFRLRLLF
jgi:hypothetical protein